MNSLDAHWIAGHLVTAGGKRIKMRLLDTVITSHYYVFNETTTRLHVQWSPTSERPDYSPSKRRTSTSFADRQKSPKPSIHLCPSALATQHREARPATHLLPAESSLLPSECSGIWLCTTGPFLGPHFLIGCNVRRPQAAGPPAYPTSEDSCVVLRGCALTSR
jgi:hypothetical protein